MDGYAITPQQMRLWQLQTKHEPFRATAVIHLEGSLQAPMLKEAVRSLVAGHDILRTRLMIPQLRKHPLQMVAEDAEFVWIELDWCGAEAENKLLGLLEKERALPVAEGEQQIPRFTLIRKSDDNHLLVVNLTAFLTDGWSLALLHAELGRLYAEIMGEAADNEAEDGIQYPQYALWLEELREEAEEATAFWSRRQAEVTTPPKLPGTANAGDGSFKPARRRIVDTETYPAYAAHKAGGESPALFLQACWQLCLARIGGTTSMDMAQAKHGRCFEELETCLGPFVRYLPYHMEWTGDRPFSRLLAELQEVDEQTLQWQDYYELQQSYLEQANPYVFEYQEVPGVFQAGPVCFRCEDRFHWESPFLVKLDVSRQDETLLFDFYYDESRLSAQTVTRWGGYLQKLLRSALENGEKPVNALSMLSTSERRQKLTQWYQKSDVQPELVCALFEARARTNSNDCAVIYAPHRGERESLSYQELNQRANQLAHYLAARGVGRGSIVPLLFDRSTALIAAMLGVLKAGAAYLVLETHHPAERLRGILGELDVDLILAGQMRNDLHGVSQVCFEPAAEAFAAQASNNPNIPISGFQPAYLLFTSGSTGKPKGVVVSHDNLAAYLAGVCSALSFPESADFALVSTPAADLGNTMIFPSLCRGGRLHVLDEELIGNPNGLADYFRESGLDCLKITPSHLGVLLQADDPAAVLPSECLVLGGEASRWDMIERIAALRPRLRIFNHYGPTETTVGVLTHPWRGDKSEATVLPLGQPIAGTGVYLLNDHLEPAPDGTPGELFIGGHTVTQGYYAQPALTAERFLPDPFSPEPGARVYRTGDQARFLADGNYEFMGRVDRQVKVRGYRVELGEIEAGLKAHANIAEVVVLFRELSEVGRAVVAYLVPQADAFDEMKLREELRQSLPEYMIPQFFCVLPRLPLTANGKIDSNALKVLPLNPAEHGDLTVPKNDVEKVLADVWARVLGLERVSTTSTIFELGGHSLQLIVLNTRIHTLFQVDLGIKQLFNHPTVEAIAQAVIESEPNPGHTLRLAQTLMGLMALTAEEKAERFKQRGLRAPVGGFDVVTYLDLVQLVNPSADLIARRDPNDTTPIPLSFAQQRLWFLDQAEGENSTYNNPTAIRFSRPLDFDVLGRCFSEMERRHEVLRTAYRLENGVPVQVVLHPRDFHLEAVDLSSVEPTQRDAKLNSLMEEEARTPFDLHHGPVWRLKLYKTGAEEYVLILIFHHICSDAWSMGIFARELHALYDAFIEGKPSPLPELEIQYGDYAAWQRRLLEGDALERELDYWRTKLAALPNKPSLPYDKPRPESLAASGETQMISLAEKLSDDLRALTQERQATLYITLLTGFYILLHTYNKLEDQVVGADVANRNQGQTAGLIGFFINQLALRTRIALDEPLEGLLERVRQTALEAYEHQELPFDKVVNAFPYDRASNMPPLFQAKFFMGQSLLQTEATESMAEGFQVNTASARLDLTMGMWDHGGGPIVGWLNYNTQLFLSETVAGMCRRFQKICQAMVENPAMPVGQLVEKVLGEEEDQLKQEGKQMAQESAGKFVRGRRQRVSVNSQQLVDIRPMREDGRLPVLITPKSADCDLHQWLTANKSVWEPALYKHGGILFRGFDHDDPERFRKLAATLIERFFTENAEHQIISDDGAIQTPVDYAADQHLLWHNENSYNYTWPQKILFACAQPAERGGETPIVDSRRMLQELPADIVKTFEEKGITYMRNYSAYLGLDWRQIFKTDDPKLVARICNEAHMDFEWHGDDQLRTFATRPAVWRHAQTGEKSWFNQAQHWHFSCLDQKTKSGLAAIYEERDYPRNCFYGDGSPIEDEVMATILETYRRIEVVFPWQRGDAVLLDNLLTAHARNSYQGPRKILVCMGDVLTYSGWRRKPAFCEE